MRIYIKILIVLAIGIITSLAYLGGFMDLNASLLLIAATILLCYLIPKNLIITRKDSLLEAIKVYEQICQKIVDYQKEPSELFDRTDLSRALGRDLAEPIVINGGRRYNILLHGEFKIRLTIEPAPEPNQGKWKFGECILLEDDIVCAKFYYMQRFITWLAEELHKIHEKYLQNHQLTYTGA